MSLFPEISVKNGRKKFLVKNIDMRYSFESLKDIAMKKVGADFEQGDIVYFENENCTRRKALTQRGGVLIMAYWMKVKGKFVEIYSSDGIIKEYIDFFS